MPELKLLNSRFAKILNSENSYERLDNHYLGDLVAILKSTDNTEFFLSIYNRNIIKHFLLLSIILHLSTY